jgi:hypothetical protein
MLCKKLFLYELYIVVQDTVIGLHALAKLAERMSSSTVDIHVSFSYTGGSPANMRVTRANSMILQKQEVCVQLYGILTHSA